MAKLKQADAEALVERALAADIVTKGGGGWLSFGETRLGQGSAKAAAHLVDNDEVAVSIAAAIAAKEQGGSSAGNAGSGATGGASTSVSGGTAAQDRGAGHAKRKAKDEKRAFKVVSTLRHDGGLHEVGDEVDLDRAQFLVLKQSGVVSGDWPEDKDT